jgi:pimeloyl-ACP methyl ester carboxylesterase
MIAADETFDGTWPYKPHFFGGNGFRQHYADEGSTDGKNDNVIVCLHGEPTWGYLYRNFIPRLRKLGRVIVPDHMGFGKSETPQDRDYSTREHSDNLERLLLHLDVRNVTLVMQDWGGLIGSTFAIRHPDRIKCLCICNANVPWARAPIDQPRSHKWQAWMNSDQYEPVVSNLGATVLSMMQRIGMERLDHIDETWLRAYSSPFPTSDSCRGALQFPRNISHPKTYEFFKELEEKHDVSQLQAIPAMCVVGEEERTTPAELRVFGFKSLWPNGPVVTLPGVSHFLQEDAPETVTALVEQFIQINSRPVAAFSEPSKAWDKSSKWAGLAKA